MHQIHLAAALRLLQLNPHARRGLGWYLCGGNGTSSNLPSMITIHTPMSVPVTGNNVVQSLCSFRQLALMEGWTIWRNRIIFENDAFSRLTCWYMDLEHEHIIRVISNRSKAGVRFLEGQHVLNCRISFVRSKHVGELWITTSGN
jgi:hypothetical protein